jgi:GT2 family glycosyltransferase
MTKLTIGMCTSGTIRAETVTSLMSNMINLTQQDLSPNILFQIGGYVDVNRNILVNSALEQKSTHIMFIDADMIFPDDAVLQLLSHDKDIIGGNYNVRLDPTAKELSGPTTKMLVDNVPVSMIGKDFPTELFKCYAVATGFMLVKLSVFEKLEMPYFDAWIDKNNKHYTEDVDFCRKAGEAGFEVYCDPKIKIGHVGSYTY